MSGDLVNMTSRSNIDESKRRLFTQKAVDDLGGTMATLMCVLGDRLGLFKDLAFNGPADGRELAQRTGINERYAGEWLNGMFCAGYLEYEPGSGRFTLPTEHAPVLAQEGGRVFLGGVYQSLPGLLATLDQLTESFKNGGGVPQEAYGEEWWQGQERYGAIRFDNLLVQRWIPGMPEVQEKLERGVLVADVGCSAGGALIKLAQAFPNSRYFGFDIHAPNVKRASQNARQAGVADRVKFERRDVVEGLPERYDVITTFDVVHDAVDPIGLVRAVRKALKDDGSYIVLEIACSDRLEENLGSLGTIKYGTSLFYCMTSSLAGGGAGLGTMGLPEPKLREITVAAGFSSVRHVWQDNFNILYEVKP